MRPLAGEPEPGERADEGVAEAAQARLPVAGGHTGHYARLRCPPAKIAGMAGRPVWEDTFQSSVLDPSRWLPYYLPQWSSRERSAARYDVGSGLRLRIDETQAPWCPELDGEVRVSSLQTGVFSGPLGSRIGQHRFHPEAVVREEQENVRLFTPHYGRIEIELAAPADEHAMAALWLIGYEDEPERSAELCVCEIFGRDVGAEESAVGLGVHPFADPSLEDDFERVRVPVDAREPHVYAADWRPDGIDFFVDGTRVKSTAQSPGYPLQLMLGLYLFPGEPAGSFPKVLQVDQGPVRPS